VSVENPLTAIILGNNTQISCMQGTKYIYRAINNLQVRKVDVDRHGVLASYNNKESVTPK
jgi:hypothetical protein